MADYPPPAPHPGYGAPAPAPPAYGYSGPPPVASDPMAYGAPPPPAYAYPAVGAPGAPPSYPGGHQMPSYAPPPSSSSGPGYGYAPPPAPYNYGAPAPMPGASAGPPPPVGGPMPEPVSSSDRGGGPPPGGRERDYDRRGGGDRDRGGGERGGGGGMRGGFECRDYQRGRCSRGISCKFRHDGVGGDSGPSPLSHMPSPSQPGAGRGGGMSDSAMGHTPRSDMPSFPSKHRMEDDIQLQMDKLDEDGPPPEVKAGFFAPPPIALDEPMGLAIEDDFAEEDKVRPLSRTKSEVLDLSEWDIVMMTADELMVHIEKKNLRRRTQGEGSKGLGGAGGGAADGGANQAEELDLSDLPPFPPLPAPSLPTLIRGEKVDELHAVLPELLKCVKDPEEGTRQLSLLLEGLPSDVLLALVEVLRQSGLARLEGKPLGFPKIADPVLPPGYTSWIVSETAEEKTQRLQRESAKVKAEEARRAQCYQQERVMLENEEARKAKLQREETKRAANQLMVDKLKQAMLDALDANASLDPQSKAGAAAYIEILTDIPEINNFAATEAIDADMRIVQGLLREHFYDKMH